MARINIILLVIILCLLPSLGSASEIVLKSGQKLEGKITEQTNKYIKIDMGIGIPVTYYVDEIDTLDGQKMQVSPPPVKVIAPVVIPVLNTPPIQEQKKEVKKTDQPIDVPELANTTSNDNSSLIKKGPIVIPITAADILGPSAITKNVSKRNDFGNLPVLLSTGMAFIALLIALPIFIYSGLCLFIISRKTKRGVPWMGFIFFVQLFLMCKIAGIRYLWLFSLFLVFVPVIGPLCIWGVFIFIWYKIALALNKPGWWGGLANLPVVNFVAWGYLAFTD